jgi:hypothetical protein
MTKEQVLYRAELAEKAYSEAKDINFRSLGLDLVKWIEHKESDTQGFIAIDSNDVVYLVWRGSSSKKDFQNDASVQKFPFIEPGEKIHIGFKSSWEAVRDLVYKTLKELDRIESIVICGHSLGGAVATLSAYAIHKELGIDRIECCTIGSPRVGNKKFKENYNLTPIKTLRIVHHNDVVTRSPKFGYHHVNNELRIDDDGNVIVPKYNLKRILKFIKSVITLNTVKDHMTDKYLAAIKKWNP